MTISERATARISEMKPAEMPIAEQFRIVAKQYSKAHSEWYFMSEFKASMLAKMKTDLMAKDGKMPDNHAERIVRSSEDWMTWVREMADLKGKESLLKGQMDYLRMKERQIERDYWAGRTEHKMGRSST